ncbi:MAG: hypothetical protein A2V70_10585 [Planctomycetes bacterium RBG_13_63_9]|nr:MAG: hypothetical protein A2V70_10585 [Planctomycetes bacterium RBG_13_63_9]
MYSGNQFWPRRSSIGIVLVGLALTAMVGCGGGNPFDQVKVSGKVTYEDGSPIEAEQIRLVFDSQAKSIDKATHPRPGNATVDVQTGEFTCASTLKFGDGLVVGPHKVRVYVTDASGVENAVDVTPAEIEVGSGSTTFDFKVKKP